MNEENKPSVAPQPAILDVGFKYENGVHTPTVLVGFAPNDFDARDAFVKALAAGVVVEGAQP